MRSEDLSPQHEPSDQRLRQRVALLLTERRHALGCSRRELARAAGVDHRVLRKAEHARLPISPEIIAQLARMYELEPDTLVPPRLPLEIRPFGVVATNGVAMSFTPGDDTSLLAGYLRLIRSVRNQEKPPVIELRRDDIDVLAAFLGWDGENVVARLGALMGVTNVQRRALVASFSSGSPIVSLTAALENAAAEQHAAAAQSTAVASRPPWAADVVVPHFSWSPDAPLT
jgi:transcriptional regulator with XRE-family HTH domain